MKKAQMFGQIFIYILAVLIAGGILILGFNAIKTFTKQAEDVSYVKFKLSIERDFRDIATDFGSVKIKPYEPGKAYEEACFIDKDIVPGDLPLFSGLPIIKDALETGTKFDLFLVPGEKQIDLGSLDVNVEEGPIPDVQRDNKFLCIKIRNGKFSIRLEGTGRSTLVSRTT